jgi:hypothetical protein
MCECEFCIKCKVCGHQADEHMCGDGPCYVNGCSCSSFDDLWAQSPEIVKEIQEMKPSDIRD